MSQRERALKQFRAGHLNGQAEMRARLLIAIEQRCLYELKDVVLSFEVLDPFDGTPLQGPLPDAPKA